LADPEAVVELITRPKDVTCSRVGAGTAASGGARRRTMARGMHARLVAAIGVALLLVVGTFWGDDDNFPFGPFRMYSTKQGLDGEVRATEVMGLTESGAWVGIPFDHFGLRRADIEGQLGKLAEPPEEVLESMAIAYERFDRGDEDMVAFRLLERTFDVEDGVPAGEEVEIVATWRRG
jgi:hypothetical protein